MSGGVRKRKSGRERRDVDALEFRSSAFCVDDRARVEWQST